MEAGRGAPLALRLWVESLAWAPAAARRGVKPYAPEGQESPMRLPGFSPASASGFRYARGAMSTTTFDTLATARALEQAGMDPAHAEAVTTAIGGAVSSTDTVTRADLDAATAALRTDLAELETRMTRTLYAVAAALLAGQLGAVFALLRLLG